MSASRDKPSSRFVTASETLAPNPNPSRITSGPPSAHLFLRRKSREGPRDFPPSRGWGFSGSALSDVRSGREKCAETEILIWRLFRRDETDHQTFVERGFKGHLDPSCRELDPVILYTGKGGDGQGSSDEQSGLDPASDGLACHGIIPLCP